MIPLLLLRALEFAARKHRDQRSKGEEASPYINHSISVALLLAEIGGVTDTDILAAAILHDTLEDTDTTVEELEAAFGVRIGNSWKKSRTTRHFPSTQGNGAKSTTPNTFQPMPS